MPTNMGDDDDDDADELRPGELCCALGHSQVDSWAIKEHPFNAEMSSRVWFFSADGQIRQGLRNGGGLAFPRQAPLVAPRGHGGPVGGRRLVNGCNEASQWLRGALVITSAG